MSLSLEDAAKIGGSDLAVVLGVSPYSTPLALYTRIVAAQEGRNLTDAGNAATRRGKALEKAVLALYAEETGREVNTTPTALRHQRLTYARASLDGVSILKPLTHVRVVDAKTEGRQARMGEWGEAGTDQVPQQHIFQMVWYGGIAEQYGFEPVVDVAALLQGDLSVYHVPVDRELFGLLTEAVERFWVNHVVPRKPPPVSEPFTDAEAAGRLYPRQHGESVHWDSLDPVKQEAVRYWLKVRARAKRAAERKAWAEAALKMALGSTPQVVGLPESLPAHRIDWTQNAGTKETDWQAVSEGLVRATRLAPYAVESIIRKHTSTKEGARPLVARERKER